ncbi:MAG: hypothetical protein ACRYFZ_03545 [Janthinobacterium lividum]
MTQTTINQRIKFLVDTLSPSARAFSEAINESPTNTFNYIGGRLVEPRAEYIEKIIRHFGNISAHWLITGEGEPFIGEVPPVVNTTTTRIKKVTGGAVHSGTGNQLITLEACQQELESTKRDMATAQKEITLLTSQLADKERTIQILLKQVS